jgi:protein TonB
VRYAFSEDDPEFDDAAAATNMRALSRHANSISYFDTRWLWGIVIVAPIVFSAGIYLLHRMASGPQARSGPPMVEVRLIEQPTPEAKPQPLPNDAASEGRREQMIDAPNRPIPEETKAAAYSPATASPGTSLEKTPTVPASRPHAVTSGSASAFQRMLLSHIARFRQYPSAAKSGQHGVTQLVFAMRRDGTVSEVRIRDSSGSRLLDEAATDTIHRAQPLPTIPADLPDQLTILLPISFDPP